MANRNIIDSRKALTMLCLASATLTVVSMLGTATAAEVEAEFTLGLANTDNVARTPVNEIDETIYMLGLDYALEHESRKLAVSIDSSFTYMNYADDTFDPEIVGGFIGSADFQIVDERLGWQTLYNWGQQRQDVFEPARPDNRDDVSVLTTGPRFIQPLGARTSIGVDLTYGNTQFETRPLDFERFRGDLRLAREVRSGLFLSANVSADRVEYSNDIFTPFDTTQYFLRLDSEAGRNIFEVDLGFTKVESGGVEGDGPLFTAEWVRTVSPTTIFRLGAGTRYSDQGDIFRFFQNNNGDLDATSGISPVGSPFRNDFVTSSISYIQNRTSLIVGAFWTSEDYELDATNGLDRNFRSLNLILNRELSRTVFIQLRSEYRSDEFESLARKDSNLTASLTGGYRFSSAINLSLTYIYFRRDSSVAITDAVENRYLVQIGYIPRWGR